MTSLGWFRTGPRTAKDCLRLVLNGPSLSPTTLWSVLDQSGPGLSKKGKKTRPDWTFKHYLQKVKYDTFDSYQAFKAWLLTQFNTKVKHLHLDHGGEYLSAKFMKYLKSKVLWPVLLASRDGTEVGWSMGLGNPWVPRSGMAGGYTPGTGTGWLLVANDLPIPDRWVWGP